MVEAPLLFAFGVIEPSGGFSHKLQAAGLISCDTRHRTDMDITVGLALKGFILKAVDLGLGTCILTAPLVFIKDIEQILELEDVRIACLVTAGFPDETPATLPGKKVADIYREI
jgi:nitroreductase